MFGEMRMKKKKWLTLAIAAVLTTGAWSVAFAEKVSDFGDENVTVYGDEEKDGFVAETGSVGILGNKDTMKVPFTTTNIAETTVEDFGNPSQPLDSVLAGSPSIRGTGSILHNDFQLRGFRANGSSSYVNGVPDMFTQFNAPLHVIEQIDVVAGPNSGIGATGTHYESNAAGGLVNFVTKRAAHNFNRLTLTHTGRGMLGGYLDSSFRTGKNNEWGIRLNIEKVDGETAVKGQEVNASSVFLNVDYKGRKSNTNLFTGYRQNEVSGGQRWFKLGGGVTKFPSVPNPSNDYGYRGQVKGSYGWLAILNHEQKMDDSWKWFANFGYMGNKLNKNVMYQNSAITILNDDGDYNLTSQRTTTPQNATYAQLGINGKIETGVLKHDITIAVDKAWRTRYATKASPVTNLGTANIYTGVVNQLMDPPTDYEYGLTNKTHMSGINFVDTISYGKMDVLLGIHRHESHVSGYSAATGKQTNAVDSSANCPTYGIMYSPMESFAVYASHSENFDGGAIVGNTYQNAGEILPPAKTKQNEIGVKYKFNNGVLASLSYFDITQANNIAVDRADGTYLVQDGQLRHKGVELAVSGRIAPKWNIASGIAYLDATKERTAGGLQDGKTEDGTPKWTASISARYKADDKFSAFGRISYVGTSTILNEKFRAPTYTVVDLGVNYRTKIGSCPALISLTCYNVFNKEYWMVSRGDNNIYLSTPRTFALSMSLDI